MKLGFASGAVREGKSFLKGNKNKSSPDYYMISQQVNTSS